MGYAIIVTFDIKPGARAAFLALVQANARQSVADEPRCRRFDVIEAEAANQVLLYEIYDDRAAFDAHLRTPHFKAFDAETRDLVVAKTVVAGTTVEHAKDRRASS